MMPLQMPRRQAPPSSYNHSGTKYISLFNMGHCFSVFAGESDPTHFAEFEALKTARVSLLTQSNHEKT
jgi:hypothetical protein